MPQPPAFPFYVQDYLMGTMALSSAERGAYVDCLCYQWEVAGVPGDDLARLSRVMRVTPTEARKLWPAIQPKFVKGMDGLYRNTRLELERAGKQRYHAAQAENGAKGGRPKKTQPKPTGSETDNPEANPKQSFTSSSSSAVPPSKSEGGPAPTQSFEPRLPKGAPGSSLQWHRLHGTHVSGFCDWKCLMADDFAQFSNRLPGGEAEALAWAKSVRASGIVPTGKPWTFWNEQFDAAFGPAAKPGAGGFSAADWAAHMPGGAIDKKLGIS